MAGFSFPGEDGTRIYVDCADYQDDIPGRRKCPACGKRTRWTFEFADWGGPLFLCACGESLADWYERPWSLWVWEAFWEVWQAKRRTTREIRRLCYGEA